MCIFFDLLCMNILPRKFYDRDTLIVARELLGCFIVHKYKSVLLIGKISETEAYLEDDQASHAFHGKTDANRALFGPVGHAYIYLSYGIHTCFNIVAYDTAHAQAGGVLIRTIIPIEGINIMQQLRNNNKNIGIGPGNVTQALAITMADYEKDLVDNASGLWVEQGETVHEKNIIAKPRIGISKNKEFLWRFVLQKN